MVTLTINGQVLQAEKGATILEAAAQADIHIPHLCYLKGLNEIAACRVCCVEVEGERAMVTACNTPVREGMVVHTNSPRARATRRTNVELILSQHDCKCATCVRSGSCHLQSVANDLGILTLPYETQLPQGLRKAWTTTFPLYHDYNKCIKCMRCIQVCEKIQTLGIWDLAGTGGRTTIDVSDNRVIKDSDCALCGQCITHCPVGGLRERDDTQRAFDALADPDKITVVQVAPAVRTAWGEYFDMPREQATIERMAAVLRRLGFDYVFDTNFSADLTIMEEGTEFLHRLQAIPQRRRPFKFHILRSLEHLLPDFLRRRFVVSLEQLPGLKHGFPVLGAGFGWLTPTGAQIHVVVQAGTVFSNIPWELLVAVRKLQCRTDCLQHGVRYVSGSVGTEILCSIVCDFAYHGNGRVNFLHIQPQVGIPLIILQQNIVFRHISLDQGAFQNQGFKFAGCHNDIEVVNFTDHGPRLRGVGGGILKILADSVFQFFCFADIDHLVRLIPHNIHSGCIGKGQGFILQFIKCHGRIILKKYRLNARF